MVITQTVEIRNTIFAKNINKNLKYNEIEINMHKKIKIKNTFLCVKIRSKNKKSGILNAYIEKMSKKGDEKIYAMCRDKRR